ncbi:MAG: hypothetical protein JWN25_3517 [Verrucomicrobiales bacterium]|nr:hypothetical protein [Verrucomicrobiales bacterium]
MNGNFSAMRATADDLPELSRLWVACHLDPASLSERFTEFQLIKNGEGKIVGAVALKITGTEAVMHGESFADFASTDLLRPLLWERLSKVATNYGLYRIWTQEEAPYWRKSAGFVQLAENQSNEIPKWFASKSSFWLSLKLKSESASPVNIDQEFERFRKSELEEREKIMDQAITLRWIAYILCGLFIVFTIVGAVILFRHGKLIPHH